MSFTKKKQRTMFLTFCTLLFAVMVGILAWYFTFLQKQLFMERSSLFVQFTEKVAENVDAAAETFWEETMICEEMLALHEVTDLQSLKNSLLHMKTVLPTKDIFVLAFNQHGYYYASDGYKGRLETSDNLSFTQSVAKQQSEIVNLPHIETTNTYYLFLNRLDKPIKIDDDENITHISIAVDLKSLQKLFTTTGFKDNCYTYLINETGRRLYKNTYSKDFIDGYNILSVIEESAEITYGGTLDDLRNAIEAGNITAYEINYLDQDWFLSNAVISSINCNLLLFVPANMIASETTILLRNTLFVFIAVLLVFLILFAGIIISALANAKTERVLLQEKAEIAASANRAKSDFLSYMSHDIRTPINGIMGMTDIALSNMGNDDKVRDCLGKINSSSHHLLGLVNDILDLSRIESGIISKATNPIDLYQMIEHCTTIIGGQLTTRELQIVSDIGPFDHAHIIGDELHLRQIFINILSNAVKFTPDGGMVTFRAKELSASDGQAQYLFEIEDTGIGMNEAFIQKLWDPFTQEHRNYHVKHQGSGLGMAITKKFVEMLDGSISVKSELNQGTTFTIHMPFKINEVGREESCSAEPMANIEGMNILLAEDNELNMEIAYEILVAAGATVTCAENGKEALDSFINSPSGTFDFILMDMMMPVMDGLEATKCIRKSAHPDGAQIPIVAMTANAFAEDIRKSKEAGMTAHLSKPINPMVLVKTLATLRK